jgi:microcystin-dependent protein
MADLPQQDTIKQYITNGLETSFAAPFYVPLDSDERPAIDVYVQLDSATPVPESDLKEWGVDYTFTTNLDPITGGTVDFLAGRIPPASSIVTLVRDVPASLNVEFSDARTFNGENLDAALDRLLLIEQQNKTYCLQRNLSYVVNSYIPDASLTAQVQIPLLGDGEIWIGTGTGVIAAELEQGADTSTLRSELANEAPVTNGAHLVGYYDVNLDVPTTVKDFLDNLNFTTAAPGDLKDYAGTGTQDGWLVCDGSAVSRTTYSDLFTAIGIAWGSGNGTTTFNLPNFQRRVAVGAGGSGTATLGNSVGNTGGEESHVQTVDELAAHDHDYSKAGVGTGLFDGGSTYGLGTNAVSTKGSSNPMNVMQPSAVVTKLIKY